MRGPDRDALDVWTDRARLAEWCSGNLNGYWRRWRARAGRLPSYPGLVSLSSWAPSWAVLGVSRLHYTLRTGGICSKQRAGLYALETFPPERHRVVREALRLRTGAAGRSLYRTPLARRRDMLAFLDMVLDEGGADPGR